TAQIEGHDRLQATQHPRRPRPFFTAFSAEWISKRLEGVAEERGHSKDRIFMPTSTQYWSVATADYGFYKLGPDKDHPDQVVTNPQPLTTEQAAKVAEAAGLWDDVSGLSFTQTADNTQHAGYDWTRVAVGSIQGAQYNGINKAYWLNAPGYATYHEV